MKTFGIYILYPPLVDLRREGLGRYLAHLLKGGAEHKDVHMVILCPSWFPEQMESLLEAEGVPSERLQIVSPGRQPVAIRIRNSLSKVLQLRGKKGTSVRGWLSRIKSDHTDWVARQAVTTTSFAWLVTLAFGLTFLYLLLLPFVLVGGTCLFLIKLVYRGLKWLWLKSGLQTAATKFYNAIISPMHNEYVVRLYDHITAAEAKRCEKLANKLKQVRAWYCPTAFWPAFNRLKAARVMCVPDVVLTEFPTQFDGRLQRVFGDIEEAIKSGEHFITYSENVKQKTLVDRYNIDPKQVSVIRHAPQKLDKYVTIQNGEHTEETSRAYCKAVLRNLLKKNESPYLSGFQNVDMKFFFYASQFRPNKNVLSLLKAFKYLQRERYCSHKLILTGNRMVLPYIDDFIRSNDLECDVLCLHGLSVVELASLYKLADLAVNPSLSEGGAPFTFNEALSVGTPVVTARIAVTEEIVQDSVMDEIMYFNPRNWRELADRMEWAIHNRDRLLKEELRVYETLNQRTWADVVEEHIKVFDLAADLHESRHKK